MTGNTTIVLEAAVRQEKGKQTGNLRKAGLIPAVVYGHGIQNQNVAIEYRAFEKVYQQAGGSSLVDLRVQGHQPVKILIQDVQYDPLTHRYVHADLHQVRMTEKINAEVNLNFIGESKAVKELGGILVKNLTKITIECLPQDLIHEVDVDISALQTLEDDVRVRDLQLPATVAVKEKEDEVVVGVQPPRSEEELKSLEEKVEEQVESVEQVEKKKKEEGETEEESAAAPTAAGEAKDKEKK